MSTAVADTAKLSVDEIKTKSSRGLKWSFLGELFSKVATPLSTMVLARLLAPEIFGIAAAVTIVVSFCETVAESGFAKFLIQHDFTDDNEYAKHISVSLYFSLFLSLIGFLIIFFARYPLSALVGNSGYEMVLVVSAIQIPFATSNAVFAAILRRKFSFRALFFIRILSCLPPFLISIPLALLHFGYWSLVIGSVAVILIQTPVLLWGSRKFIKPYFSFKILKNMLAFSMAMIVEAIIIWFCTWTSTFLATNFFDNTTVGLIKVSNSTVNSLFSLFSIPFISVLFPTLSRLKDNKEEYESAFHRIQCTAFALLVPLGIGGYFYSPAIVSVFLGESWGDASSLVAILCLTFAINTSNSYFLSEVFRSKGHYWFSIIFQVLILAVKLALFFTMGRYSLNNFIMVELVCAAIFFVVTLAILKFKYQFHITKVMLSFLTAAVCAVLMVPMMFLGLYNSSTTTQYVSQIVLCASIYFATYAILFKEKFKDVSHFILSVGGKKK